MTVAPRYAAYEDVHDTGHLVPLALPQDLSKDHPPHGRLFFCREAGVDRVFIDHSLFQPSAEDDRSTALIYPSGYAPWVPAENLEICYSVLCQAALGAPLILWPWSDQGRVERPLGVESGKVGHGSGGRGGWQGGRRPRGFETGDGVGPDEGPRGSIEKGGESSAVVFVCNDWPCGLLPLWLELYKGMIGQDGKGDITQARAVAIAGVAGGRSAMVPSSIVNELEVEGGCAPCVAVHEEAKESSTAPDHSDGEMGAEADPHLPAAYFESLRRSNAIHQIELAKFQAKVGARLADSRLAFAIHNVAYQGKFHPETFPRLCLPNEATPRLLWWPGSTGIASDLSTESAAGVIAGDTGSVPWQLNWLKAGLTCSDVVVTVSPGYATELMRDKAKGCGMGDVLRQLGIKGIMNGIDVEVWNPRQDQFLGESLQFGLEDVEEGKRRVKAALQERIGLDINPDIPLFGFVGRMDHQKGADVILAAASALFCHPTQAQAMPSSSPAKTSERQLVVLGRGEAMLETGIQGLQVSFPGKAAGVAEFDEELAHLIIAGSDFLLIPSRFEPCGLVALCTVRYGTIPIASPVGGLKDLLGDGRLGYLLPEAPWDVALRQAVTGLVNTMEKAMLDWHTQKFYAMRKACMQVRGWALDSWETAVRSFAGLDLQIHSCAAAVITSFCTEHW
ncbi:unnamed protein product [Ostreobium quekettii]|uniref:Starch synthase catalytic domain-containing protein n=1 Tax=Ostreobium quekettii TaxID=121088 RepID=A0A8S1IXV3_9CHLO|nr:unnamed protein product [Ostreobium quekettii]